LAFPVTKCSLDLHSDIKFKCSSLKSVGSNIIRALNYLTRVDLAWPSKIWMTIVGERES
jgi:hypothetical protein